MFHVTKEQVLSVLDHGYTQDDYQKGRGHVKTHYTVRNNHAGEDSAIKIDVALILEAYERQKVGNFDPIDVEALTDHLK